MTAFATADDFATRLGVDLTANEQTDVTALLELASDMIRDATGQTISEVTDDEITLRGSSGSRIRLSQRPVTEVTAVTLAGQEVSTDAYYLDGDELVRSTWMNNQNQFAIGGGWGNVTDTLQVTYTHGYATIPGTVKAITLEMVARVWVNPGNVLAEVHGSEQVTYQRSNGLILTADELAAINMVVGRNIGTIQLR